MHFSFKIWYLVATISVIFLRINLPYIDAFLCKPTWWNATVSPFPLSWYYLGEWHSLKKYLGEWHSSSATPLLPVESRGRSPWRWIDSCRCGLYVVNWWCRIMIDCVHCYLISQQFAVTVQLWPGSQTTWLLEVFVIFCFISLMSFICLCESSSYIVSSCAEYTVQTTLCNVFNALVTWAQIHIRS